MNKKYLLLLIVISSILALALFTYKSNQQINKLPNTLTNPSDIILLKEPCYYEDQLSYKYYQDDQTDQSKIQKNIGYVNNKFGL